MLMNQLLERSSRRSSRVPTMMSVDLPERTDLLQDLMDLPLVPTTQGNDSESISVDNGRFVAQPERKPPYASTKCSTDGHEEFLTPSDQCLGRSRRVSDNTYGSYLHRPFNPSNIDGQNEV